MPFLDWSDAEGLYGLLRDLNESIEAELADDPVVEHLVACRDEVERITEPGPIDAEASTRRAETSAEQLQRQALLKMPVEARRGEIWWVDFNPTKGSGIQKTKCPSRDGRTRSP